jgi:hypothetical protein
MGKGFWILHQAAIEFVRGGGRIMDETQLKVGQTLYFASGQQWIPSGNVTVTRIGRKWAYLSNGRRMSKESFVVDGVGFTSPGCCWLSKEEHDAQLGRQRTWASIWALVGSARRAPAHLTIEELQAIEGLLKGERKEWPT